MPRLNFPFGPDGLMVPALVGLPASVVQPLQAQGFPLPASVHARGMSDCGSTITAVAPWVLSRLNAVPGVKVQTRTAAGTVNVRYYWISITIYNLTAGSPSLTREDWQVTDLVA